MPLTDSETALPQFECRLCGCVFFGKEILWAGAQAALESYAYQSPSVPHECDETRLGLADMKGIVRSYK